MSESGEEAKHQFSYGIRLIDGTELLGDTRYGPVTHQETISMLPTLILDQKRQMATHHLIKTEDGCAFVPSDKILYFFVRRCS